VGDLAYVVKRVREQTVIDHRVCFSQVKQLSGSVSRIQPHQLEFYAGPWFGHYLLLGKPISLVAKTSLIDAKYLRDCLEFDFTVPTFLRARGIYDYENFLLSFLQLKGLGPNVTGRVRKFVEIIYKGVGWDLDPPKEIDGYFLDSDSGGFAIIEITISLTAE
jgi:hypothetical protein